MLVEFSDLYIPSCGEIFSIYDIHIPRKCIESMQFYSCLSALAKIQVEFFENMFPSPKTKAVEETMLLYQNSIGKCEDGLEH